MRISNFNNLKKQFYLFLLIVLGSRALLNGQIVSTIDPLSDLSIAYGATKSITSVLIEETEVFDFGVTPATDLHHLTLTATGGFKFKASTITVTKTGTEVTKPELLVSDSTEYRLVYTFSAIAKTQKNSFTITGIELEAAVENTSPSGGITVSMDTLKGDGSLDRDEFYSETVGTYTMVSPSININAGNACENQPYDFNVTVVDGTIGETTTFENSDRVTIRLVDTENGANDTTLVNNKRLNGTGDNSNSKDISLDSLASYFDSLVVEVIFTSGWMMSETLIIGDGKDIEIEDTSKVTFVDDESSVSVTIYEADVPLSKYINDAGNCGFLIDSDDAQYFYEDTDGEYYFMAGSAAEGTFRVLVSKDNENGNCEVWDSLFITVIPDVISAEDNYCYGLENNNIVKISRAAIDDIFVAAENDTATFERLEIYGNGGLLEEYSGVSATSDNFYEFTINPDALLWTATGDVEQDVSILFRVVVDVKSMAGTEYTEFYSVSSFEIGDFDDCYDEEDEDGNTDYYCRNLDTIYSNELIYAASEVSKITVPKGDGIILDYSPMYCQNTDSIRLQSNNTIENISVNFVDLALDTIDKPDSLIWQDGDDYYLGLFEFAADTNTDILLTLEYYDENGCSGSTVYTPVIQAVPNVEISADTVCEGTYQSLTQYSSDSVWVNVVKQSWDFGDGDIISNSSSGNTDVESGTHGGNTTGSYKSPSHLYDEPGLKYISLLVESDAGCVNFGIDSITIGKYPTPSFRPEGRLNNDTISFTNRTDSVDYDSIYSIIYTFNKPSGNVDIDTLGNHFVYNYLPDEYGVYSASIEVVTDNGCSTIKDTLLPVYEVIDVDNSELFTDNFSSATLEYGWIHSGEYLDNTQSSWHYFPIFGEYDDADEHSDGNIWMGGFPAYTMDDEQSWLESPCFDIRDLEFPMISLDIFQSIETGRDGAAIFFSVDDGDTWELLGTDDSGGSNWYNASGIFNYPGESFSTNEGFYGWSKDTTGWVVARHSLDRVKLLMDEDNSCVRFRVAYNSNTYHNEEYLGLAIDNFHIGQRKKIILHEEFINSAYEENYPNDYKTDYDALNTFTESLPNEVCDIRYHISTFHDVDP